MFSELNAILALWDRFRRWRGGKEVAVESVATRFLRLFETHGVHRNQIPRFFNHGLSANDVKDAASLLAKLDEACLENACTRFAVRREWLDGADLQAHNRHLFYKDPEAFSRFLDRLQNENPGGQLAGVVLASPDTKDHVNALILLQEIIGFIGDKPIHRYHLLSEWSYSYWKSRAYLTACVAIAWSKKIYLSGRIVHAEEIDRIQGGDCLLGWHGDSYSIFRGQHWYPEDMALEPDVFLAGVDPEKDNFGIRSALMLWLELDSQGLMDIGLKHGEARSKFIEHLERLS